MTELPPTTRSIVRTLTILAACTALMLAMLAPFVGVARAGTVSPFAATDGTLDGGVDGPFPDSACGSGDDTQPIGGSVKIDDIQDQPPPVIESKTLGAGKSDLCNLWTDTAVDGDGDIWLYIGLSRFANNGSQVTYVELFDVAPSCDIDDIATCNPFESRDQGSRVIAFDFHGNESIIDAQLRTWDAATSAFSALTPLGSTADGRTGDGGSFAELSINLSDADILPNINDATECDIVAAALPYTVTGNADQASMIDVILTEVDPVTNCGALTVSKQVAGGDDFGAVFPITLSDGAALDRTENLGHGDSFTQADLVAPGSYTVAEDLAGLPGWAIDSIACSDGSSSGAGIPSLSGITVTIGQTTTCTVTNSPDLPTITLHKTVVNDDGGALDQADFPSFLDGAPLPWDSTVTTTPGAHAASETAQPGYAAGPWEGDCAADGTFTAELGGDYVCEITNDDVPAGLTVIKEVVNDDGGTLGPGDFPLEVTPEGATTQVVDSGVETTVAAGTYTIGEQQQDDYTLVSITCDNGVEAAAGEDTVTVTVGLGESVTCTLVNDDEPEPVTEVLPDVAPSPAPEPPPPPPAAPTPPPAPEPAPEPTLEPAAAALPATGTETVRLALLAVLVAALGATVLIGTRDPGRSQGG